ncbi:MAG: hypothetical protein RLZZ385_1197 [Pseudomonadota bacterium]|jgi:secreted PhoX family phosphatase
MTQHDESENIGSNTSGNRPFSEVLSVNLDRRKFLKGGATTAVGVTLFSTAQSASALPFLDRWMGWWQLPLIDFTPVSLANGKGPEPAIAAEYQFDVILPWGDPIVPSGPAYTQPMTSANQAQQIGIGHDGMWFFPIIDVGGKRYYWNQDMENDPWLGRVLRTFGNHHGVLCFNCEFGTNYHVIRKDIPTSLEEVRVSQHAHGVTIVEIKREAGIRGGAWKTVEGNLARRIHVNTPVEFSGPAAGHPDLQNNALNEPLGTVNNCANGYTPWGTYLTCEENFNGYFGTDSTTWTPTARQARLGLNAAGFGYFWHRFDPRFDLANPDYANEHNRFGWVVEIDPFDPNAKPIKRTALGRKKNEGATVHESHDGRIVVYNGDDESFDYVYKFVSAAPWREMRANGESPLDRGTLFVAKFNDDGTGEWLELSSDNEKLAGAFASMGELLINARLAADLAGATPMDRPEWLTVASDGRVYLACTNNSGRNNQGIRTVNGRPVDSGANAANPLTPNADGHIIRWIETYGHSGTTFEWEIFKFAKDTHGTEESFADPDGIWADPDGRLFIQTDGGQKDGLQNQMLVADTLTGKIKRLFTGVPGCEITGVAVTPNRRTMFINIQHPGDGDPAVSPWPAAPGSTSIPRDATIVITRKDNGVIGS